MLVIAYRSNSVIALLCGADPACYALARRTVVLGAYVDGAPAALSDMRDDEGIVQRMDAALQLLAKARPGKGWEQYSASPGDVDVTKRIAWSKVIAAGHSQGGGHAAFLASLVPLRRVVQLASTCDAVGAAPVPWTSAGNTWALSPATGFVGFAAPTTFDAAGKPSGGDIFCPQHLKVWQNMGLDPSRMHDDAAVCGVAGNTHLAAIDCVDNYAAWGTLF